ncbi:HpcH/HpaI aldolase/citrate lyase family protein [Bordetella sp. 02P26C-1]|uniref:HpcH/HpaI aldolase/citrate lyase family protein n=1 Tax=Bordetella sp. 02P26C-1 TaxID=2683195 RepID=UPI00135291B8|nr:CoA ester lyase [Bordetella sp. 02P26C-1]MVW79023.1 CoA ester lyase [Bordetella sp. 02P26C-1]
MRKLRSVLYVPAANEKAMRKAATLSVDAVIFDLEDSVFPEQKTSARTGLAAFLAQERASYQDKYLAIRVNGSDTEYWKEDLAVVADIMPDAVLLPKVTAAQHIALTHAELSARAIQTPKIWAMIENPLGILRLESIVENGKTFGLECLVLGTNDLIKDSDIEPGKDRSNLIPWFSHVMLVAKALNVTVIDGVLNDINNVELLQAECNMARALGMNGKSIIHPAQVNTVNKAFSPDEEQIAWWQKIVAAYAQPENQNAGVINLDGTMVERLHLEIAERKLRQFR